MKKYQQLLIVSLGLVSFICFLIYKHEYDRLRNVLEVLEVFGSPPPQNTALRSHPLDLNDNPALMADSINELNLGQGANSNRHNYDGKGEQVDVDDTFISKNGHGVRPPDAAADDNDPKAKVPNKNDNVIQNPIQNSGEVMDNNIDDTGRNNDVGLGKISVVKARKVVQRQESIFKGRQKISNDV